MLYRNVLKLSKAALLLSSEKQVLRLRSVIQRRCASGLSYMHGIAPASLGQERLRYQTIGDVIADAAHSNPTRVAIKSLHEDKTITYQEFIRKVDALGCALRGYGLERGDRVAIWSHNCAGWVVTMVAAIRVGLIPVAINPLYEKPELAFCIKKTECKAIVIGESVGNRSYYEILSDLIPEVRSSKPGHMESKEFPSLKTVITVERSTLPGTVSYEQLINDYSRSSVNDVDRFAAEVSPEDGSIIHFTSGTTGEPKAALDSHFGIVNNTYFVGRRNLLHEGHQTVCIQVPIFHALGSVVTVLSPLQFGSTLVIPAPIYNISMNLEALTKERCSVIVGTPTMFVDLVSMIQSQGLTLPGLQVALTAGSPCSPQLFKDITKYLNVKSVKSLFGMTELTASCFQSIPGETMEQTTETVGFIQDHVEAKVVDSDGNVVPYGTPGELLVRGYNVMKCYWEDPEKTKETIDKDGWLSTGDTFILNEDGYGRIVGRKKDIIMRGGENIAPKEVEDLLNSHPDVIESQVVGVNHARLGEEVCAALRLRPSASQDVQQFRSFCNGKLARFKIPTKIVIVDSFPKTASGKIQKYKLKEIIEKGQI